MTDLKSTKSTVSEADVALAVLNGLPEVVGLPRQGAVHALQPQECSSWAVWVGVLPDVRMRLKRIFKLTRLRMLHVTLMC